MISFNYIRFQVLFKLCLKDQLTYRGTWVAQLGKQPTLGVGSVHDLTVRELEPHTGLCAQGTEPALNPVSLSLPLPHLCTHALRCVYRLKIHVKKFVKTKWLINVSFLVLRL